MGGQTVTILVQSLIICLTLGAAIWAVSKWQRETQRSATLEKINASLQESCDKFLAQIGDFYAANERLREQLAQIPLAPKPEKVKDTIIRAKSPAAVRQITEQQWGSKPGEPDEQVH